MGTNGHSGHPLKWFKDQNAARQYWECAICLEVLSDPVQVRDCGHQFCALCIDDILKSDPRCPSCRIEISKAMIFDDHAARRMIKQLDVNCCNEGCSWQGCLSSLLQDHQHSCNFLIRSGENASQLDVGKLEQKLKTLMLKVATLEKKHEEDIKKLTLKHAEDVKVLRQEILMSRNLGAAHAPRLVQPLWQLQEPEPTYTWKIANFTRMLARVKSNNDGGDFDSEPFFSSHGYKMKIVINLNEEPRGYAGYMGVYLVLMKSDRDRALSWPFTKPYTFVLLDQQDDVSQRQNISRTIVPDGEAEFKRPRQRENVGGGEQQFVKHSTLRTRQYIRDHAVYITILIDP